MYQRPRYVTDQTGGNKLEVSLPGGRYQLTLEDRAVNVLENDLGLAVRDYVPELFIPFFIATGDAWFPRENKTDDIISNFDTTKKLKEHERDVLVSYVCESRIPKRHEQRIKSLIEDSLIADVVNTDDLQTQELPAVPDWLETCKEPTDLIDEAKNTKSETSEQTPHQDIDSDAKKT